ncbi:MAG TPA: PHP-associated domain-containing protein [Methanomassiliicoccales archaeon]|nr:PHP-associated domain-containing protein [Methanomassiliicoccales archaeon]
MDETRGTRNTKEEIRFERPNLKRLAEEGFTSIDMHLHTDHSDGHMTVERVLKKARDHGFGIAVTDHNEVTGSLKAFAEKGDVLVVPAIEISASDGPHILAYFHSARDLEDFHHRYVEPKQRKNAPWLAIRSSTQTIVDALDSYNCLTVAAHPYGYLVFNKGVQKCIDLEYMPHSILNGFDGLEAICGGMGHSLNARAVRLIERTGKCFTGGTDAHMLGDVGGVVTCAQVSTLSEFLEELGKCRNLVIGKEKTPAQKLVTGTVLMGKHSRYFMPSMRVHLEQNLPRVRHYVKRKTRDLNGKNTR